MNTTLFGLHNTEVKGFLLYGSNRCKVKKKQSSGLPYHVNYVTLSVDSWVGEGRGGWMGVEWGLRCPLLSLNSDVFMFKMLSSCSPSPIPNQPESVQFVCVAATVH